MDENMETMTAAVDAAWNDGEETTAPETAPAQEQTGTEQTSGAPEAAETQEGQEQGADQAPELFTLKNLGETRQVGRDELIALGQKGWDYDRVKTERDELRDYRTQAEPALALVERYAQRNGMTVAQYLDFCAAQEYQNAGMDEQTARQKVAMDRQQAELDQRQADLDAEARRDQQAQEAAQAQREAQRRDFESFLRMYPAVDPKSIPQEVWAQVQNGIPLTTAYTIHENQRLQQELTAERQNTANRGKAPGAMGGTAEDDNMKSLIAKYWDEG